MGTLYHYSVTKTSCLYCLELSEEIEHAMTRCPHDCREAVVALTKIVRIVKDTLSRCLQSLDEDDYQKYTVHTMHE